MKDPEYSEIIILILIAVITSITFAWIEAGINRISATAAEGNWKSDFFENRFLNHFATYHLFLAVLAIGITFGYFFTRIKWIISERKYWFFFISFGNLLLWAALEDNMAMFFMSEPYTATSWTNWVFGATNLGLTWFPNWIILAYLLAIIFWVVAIKMKIKTERSLK